MTRDMFIKTLQDNMVQFKVDIEGDVCIDMRYILIGSTAYITPSFLCSTEFHTLIDGRKLEGLNPSDLEPLILHYRKFHPQKSTEECPKEVFADPKKYGKSIKLFPYFLLYCYTFVHILRTVPFPPVYKMLVSHSVLEMILIISYFFSLFLPVILYYLLPCTALF